MDRQLRYAQLFRFFYKLVFKLKLYKYDLSKKFPSLLNSQKKQMEKIVLPDDTIVVLPRERSIDINKKIDNPESMVLPMQVIDHFIDESGYRVIMNKCICRESNNCENYSIEDYSCIFMGEAAKFIHPDLCRPVSKEEAKEHMRKSRETGLMNIIGRAKFDAMWLGVEPHEKLLTLCNCCPCCCITTAIPYMNNELTKWFHKMPGLNIKVNDECIGCEKCLEVCVYNGIEMKADRAFINDNCRGCGRCVEECPNNAIDLTIEDDAYIKETINLIAPNVDIS